MRHRHTTLVPLSSARPGVDIAAAPTAVLPVAGALTALRLPQPRPSAAESLPSVPMPKILLVEDNEMNRDMLARRLAKRGYEVVVAIDGEQGVARAETERPALILMDMSLPVMDGWEAVRRLKGMASTRHIPVIALTAHAMTGDREKALESGCDDFDTKPVDLGRLLGKIETLLIPRAEA